MKLNDLNVYIVGRISSQIKYLGQFFPYAKNDFAKKQNKNKKTTRIYHGVTRLLNITAIKEQILKQFFEAFSLSK